MQKINPYRQDRIYACILQIIWQYKKNFQKTIQGISKSLFSYLITFEKDVPWIVFYESNKIFSESA